MFRRLTEDIATIRERDPAARSSWEVLTCYPGLHALFLHRIAHRCWTGGWLWLGRWLSAWARFLTGIEIHPGATIGRRVFIDHGVGVVIGETAEVGDDCTIYQGVTLGGTSLNGGKRHPTLHRGVVVSAGAKVLGPFTVGENARVGANAVLLREVPAGATAVGIPARIIVKSAVERGEQTAARTGFAAYAVTRDAEDPLSIALHGLIDQTAELTAKVEAMAAALDALGACPESCKDEAPFDARRLNEMVD
jgi:serine O-acetyltransferase